jgi:hypothetical protein
MQRYPKFTDQYEAGKVTTQIKVRNSFDLLRFAHGETEQTPQTFEGSAVVDTCAVHLYLRESVVTQLGLRERRKWTSNGMEMRRVFSAVNLEIMGRRGTFDVVALPDEYPNVVGYIPLYFMDWVIDMRSHQLAGNPEHGGEWLTEEYSETLSYA